MNTCTVCQQSKSTNTLTIPFEEGSNPEYNLPVCDSCWDVIAVLASRVVRREMASLTVRLAKLEGQPIDEPQPTPTFYVRDDLGDAWTFDGARVYNVLAELEECEENGYACGSWGEAIEILNRAGYVTGFTEPGNMPDDPDEEYLPTFAGEVDYGDSPAVPQLDEDGSLRF